jgi:hypothetical protein
MAALEEGMAGRYRDGGSDAKRGAVGAATAELKKIYRQNFFPTMKARWDAYPGNGELRSATR